MKANRILSLAVSLVTVLSLIAGCTGNGASSQATSQASPGSSAHQASSDDRTSNADDFYVHKTGDKIVDKPITLKIAIGKHSTSKNDIQDKENIKWLESTTNVKVEWTEIPQANVTEKVNIMLAGGDLPDVFANLLKPNQLLSYYKTGVFLPLNDLIGEWGPNFVDAFERYPYIESYLTMEDGNIYATPGGELSPWLEFRTTLFINQDWLGVVGMKRPATTEEYYQVLKAFKEKDPNGNGIADEIPLSLCNEVAQRSNILTMAGYFGIPMCYGFNEPVNYITVLDGKAVFAPATDNFREFLTYFNRLYSEGLLDMESFSQSIDQFRAKAKNDPPLIGSFNQFLEDTNVGDNRIEMYPAIPPLTGPYGDNYVYKEKLLPALGAVLGKNNPHPEATMRWLDFINTDMFMKTSMYNGLEEQGVWSRVENDMFVLNSDKAPEGVPYQEWAGTIGAVYMPIFQLPDEIARHRVLDARPARKLEQCKLYDQYDNEDTLPAKMMTTELQDAVNLIQPDLVRVVDSFVASSVLEGIDDAKWNAFLSQIEKAKYKDYEILYQQFYDYGKK